MLAFGFSISRIGLTPHKHTLTVAYSYPQLKGAVSPSLLGRFIDNEKVPSHLVTRRTLTILRSGITRFSGLAQVEPQLANQLQSQNGQIDVHQLFNDGSTILESI